MANYKNVIPFILKWEGGLSKNPSDFMLNIRCRMAVDITQIRE